MLELPFGPRQSANEESRAEVHVGQSRHDTAFGSMSAAFAVSGALVGGAAGCNHQTGPWLFGLEGDLSWTNKKGSAVEVANIFMSACRTSVISTLRLPLFLQGPGFPSATTSFAPV